jgi:glycosyltransferase involved in cell wall biosynthesis
MQPPFGGILEGAQVCMLVMNDVRNDARVQKEAQALAEAGARVVILGMPEKDGTAAWATDTFEVRVVERHEPSTQPLWPVRVAANLIGEYAAWRRLERAARSVGADVIHCHDLDTAWAGMTAAGSSGAKLVYDAHELYTERPGFKWWQIRAYRRIERRILERADVVFTANEERAEIMADMYGTSRPMIPLLNVPSRSKMGDLPNPAAVAARAELGCERLLIYQGGLADGRGLETVVAALEELPESYHLAVMGPGEPAGLLKAAMSASSLRDRVHLWPAVTPDEVIGWAAVADAGIVSYLPNGLNNVYCAPNKLYDYVGAGIGVIAADLPPLRKIVEQHAIGTLFKPGDASSVVLAANALLGDEDTLSEARANAQELRDSVYWEKEAEKLVHAYEALRPSPESQG